MKQLLVFTAIVSAISSLPLVEDYYGPYWSENRFKGVLQEAFNSSGSIHHRFIRANADKLNAALERLQRIARITNGIYLLKELIAGTIPADELISELLFFGPVTSSEITNLDEKAIVAAIDTLKSLPDNLKASNEASKTETSFGKLNELLKKIKGIGNLNEWNGKQNFKDEIERLATKGIDTTFITGLGGVTFFWNDNVPKIKNSDATLSKQNFEELKKGLDKLKTSIKSFGSSGIHWRFEKFDTLMDGLSPITKAAEGVNIYKPSYNILKITDKDGTTYSSFLDETSSKISSISQVDPHLQVIRKLIVSKETKSRQRTLKHTHGMPRGLIDVKEATYDIGDPWIGKLLTTDQLKVAFKKLEGLETLLSKPEDSLDFKKQGVTAMDGLLGRVSSVNHIFTNILNVKTGLAQTYECKSVSPQKVDSTQFELLKQKLIGIDNKLKLLKEETKKLSPQLNKEGLVGMCDDVIKICEEAQKATNIQDSVGKFKSYGKLKQLDDVFKELHSISIDINGIRLDEVKVEAEAVKNSFGELEKYHTGLNHYSEYFSCLQKQDKLKLVLDLVDDIKGIRKLKSDKTFESSLNNGLVVVKKVTGVKKDLEISKSEIDKLKGFKSSETNDLNVFQNSGELSKVIGEAVQGVANMKNLLDKRTETVDKVLNNLQFVKDNQKLITDPTDMKNLQELINLDPSIQSMYSTLNTFIGGVKDNDSPVLKNHSDFFESAKTVSGITGDFLAMSSSVEKLKTKIPGSNELEELQTSLKTMDNMGLDFSKYQTSFDNSDSALGNLDIAFADYNKRMARKVPPPSTQQQGNPRGSQGSGNNQSEKKDDNTTMVVIIIAGLSIAFVLAGSTFSGYKYIWIPRRRRARVVQFLDSLMDELYCIRSNLLEEKNKKEEEERKKKGLPEPEKKEADEEKPITPEEVDAVFNASLADERKRMSDQCSELSACCNAEECDFNYPMVEETSVKLKGYGDLFKSDHYHAIWIPISKKKKFIISHVPTKRTKKTPETVAKFFWMAKQYRSKTIVHLDKKSKDSHYDHIPENKGDKESSENITIHCLEKEIVDKKFIYMRGCIQKRKLKVEIKNHKPFTVNHIWYRDWDLAEDEVNAYDLAYILLMIDNDKTPPIIASTGMKKSECLAFGLFGRMGVYDDPGLNVGLITRYLAMCVYSLFEIPRTYRTAILVLYDFLSYCHKTMFLRKITIDNSISYHYAIKDKETSVKNKVSPKKEIPAKIGAPLKNEVKIEVPHKK